MRDNSKRNTRNPKVEAERMYRIRKLDKYIKWSVEQRGGLRWKDLIEQQNMYKIKVV